MFNNRYLEFISSYGNELSCEKAKELYIYELRQFGDSEKIEDIINKIKNMEGSVAIHSSDLKLVFENGSFPTAEDDRENLIRLKIFPLLYWTYYNSLKKQYPSNTFEQFNFTYAYDNYIKYKEILPDISSHWKQIFEHQIQLLAENKIGNNSVYDYLSLIDFINRKLDNEDDNWDHSIDNLLLKAIPSMVEHSVMSLMRKPIETFELYSLRGLAKSLTRLNSNIKDIELNPIISLITEILADNQSTFNINKSK